jgi:hypothetical protein
MFQSQAAPLTQPVSDPAIPPVAGPDAVPENNFSGNESNNPSAINSQLPARPSGVPIGFGAAAQPKGANNDLRSITCLLIMLMGTN